MKPLEELFIFYLILIIIQNTFAENEYDEKDKPCLFSETINITNGAIRVNGDIEFEKFVYNPKIYAEYDYIMVNESHKEYTEKHIRGCKCKVTNCVRFCKKARPFINLTFANGTSEVIQINQSLHPVIGTPCPIMFGFKTGDGVILFHENGTVALNEEIYHHDKYCLKYKKNGSTSVNYCFEEPEVKPINIIYPVAMAVSIPFLIATFIVYAIIPELRNMHGKILMCYLACLTVDLIFIIETFLKYDIENRRLCTALGYTSYYFGLTPYFWLNVMSIEIFTKIVLNHSMPRRSNELKLFAKFFIYGFGAPLLLTFFMFFLDHTVVGSIMQDEYHPKIGMDQDDGAYECSVQSPHYSKIKYVYSILTIITLTNLILFILIILEIYKVKKDIKNISDSFVRDKERFLVYFKLFIVLGIFFIMEPISSYFEGYQEFFYLTDVINCLQGVIIFVLLVMKKNVLKLLKQRFSSKPSSSSKSNSTQPSTPGISTVSLELKKY